MPAVHFMKKQSDLNEKKYKRSLKDKSNKGAMNRIVTASMKSYGKKGGKGK